MRRSPSEPTDDDLSSFYDANRGLTEGDLPDSPGEVGVRIARAREEAGMSVEELAGQLGVRAATVQRWEAGRSTPRPNRLTTIAGLVGVGVSWLLMGHGEAPAEPPELDDIRAELAGVRRSLGEALAAVDALAARLALLDNHSGSTD